MIRPRIATLLLALAAAGGMMAPRPARHKQDSYYGAPKKPPKQTPEQIQQAKAAAEAKRERRRQRNLSQQP